MSADVSGASGAVDWTHAWGSALSALELDVITAEKVLASDHLELVPAERWQPPVGLGPLPRELHERARTLLDRQIEAGRQLGEAARLSKQHSRAAQAMRPGGPAVPVYVDIAG